MIKPTSASSNRTWNLWFPKCVSSTFPCAESSSAVTNCVVALVLCGLIRSSRTDASARTCVCYQTCFARWNRRHVSHASWPSRSSATRIRSHRCLDPDTCTWCFSSAMWRIRCCAARSGICSHWFPLCIGQVFQSRPAPGLCMTCLPAVAIHYLRRFLPCILAMLAFALALRLHTDLHWHKIAVSALLCSRDLEVLLSYLYTARDSCAFTDETSFDSLVLHSQHIHIRHDVIDRSLSYLCRYVVFAFARQHVPQESNTPWVPFSHELPPPCEFLVHTCIATPVQCLHHHEYVVHQHAELSDESRRRRLSAAPSTAPRYDLSLNNRSARIIGSLCVVVDVAFWTCSSSSILAVRRIVSSVSRNCWSCTFNCWLAIVICSSGVDMDCWHAVLPAVLNSRIHRGCPRFELWLQSLSDCFALILLTVLTPAFSGAPCSTLSTRSSPLRQSTSLYSSVPRLDRFFREATITAPLPWCECMRWDDTYTHVFCARRRAARIRVTHVHTRSDCVLTRDDTVRLNYASRFVRVIYSSHIVSIKLDTVTIKVN